MRFSSLGSGSRGNATLIEHANTCLLLDCGFTLKETERRLARLDKSPQQISAILVTHEHSDHANGVGPLARKYDLPVYLTAASYQQSRIGQVNQLHNINCHSTFAIMDIQIQPVPVPHDAREPCQFIFDDGAKKLGVLTDLGSITPFVKQSYRQLDSLLLECNHDLEMLEQGPYPLALKRRISGEYGHLSNNQAGDLLREIEIKHLQHLVISHISEQNNSTQRAVNEVVGAIGCSEHWLTVADQTLGFDWRVIS